MVTHRKKSKAKRLTLFRARFNFILPILLILIGVALIGYAAMGNFSFNLKQETINNKHSFSSNEQEAPEIKPQYSKIKSINIPKINRDLTVEDGSFVDGRWEVAAEGVSYYTDSSLPEEGGNTVLYGHNKTRILGGLVDMKRGDKVELALESGKVLSYEVVEVKTIKPSEVSILNQTEDHQLTIYTCTGFLDSARFVVIAKKVTSN